MNLDGYILAMSNSPDRLIGVQERDAIDSYFDCVTACSLGEEGVECVTQCIEVHLKTDLE